MTQWQGDRSQPAVSTTGLPWPRFTSFTAPATPRASAPHEPWPRWGVFPREHRAWNLAPGPSLTSHSPAADPVEDVPAPRLSWAGESDDERIPEVESEMRWLPAQRPVTMELVPVARHELMLGEVMRAARRAAPAAAVGAAAAVMVMGLLRRR